MPATAEAAPTVNPGSSPTARESPASAPADPGGASGPVAVVWCRQVDNEAESPGYTTVPDEFPGRRETLEAIRLVGNLTINVADTQDYWTPGPPAPLSYYPNLFLYPAYGGRYTCIGRMFLSTEDRPRLGMKTLVLETSQLLATGEFGAAVLRWHASIAGPRKEGARPPPVPDPRLFALLGEGFLFHRGSTDPVLVVAAGEWEAAMETVQELVRSMPASLLTLGAVLAFPYFLPQAKTNLHEFTEQIPLALALMRIPPLEATGERLEKRLQSWESVSVTLRNLLDGIPEPTGKGKEKDGPPLVLQYVRDQNLSRLGPIAQRVDLVELPKLRALLADPERQGGKERRKEMWRIGTAMESAALLLQRARGRHVPVSVETAKRAQSYLQAKLPSRSGDLEPAPSAPVVRPAASAAATPASRPAPASGPGSHPPWLVKSAPLPFARSAPEVVPVSRSDDPSTLPGASPTAPLPSGVVAPAVAPQLPPAELRREIESTVNRLLDQREADSVGRLLPKLAPELLARLRAESSAQAENQIRPLVSESEARLTQAVAALETRLKAAQPPAGTITPELEKALLALIEARLTAQAAELAGRFQQRLGESEGRLTQQSTALLASTENRLREALTAALASEVDRRVRSLVEKELVAGEKGQPGGRIAEANRAAVAAQLAAALAPALAEQDRRTDDRIRAALASAPLAPKAQETVSGLIAQKAQELAEGARRAREELRSSLFAQLEAQRATSNAQLEEDLLQAMAKEMDARGEELTRLRDSLSQRIADSDARRVDEHRATEERTLGQAEIRQRESASRLTSQLTEAEGRLRSLLDERATAVEGRLKGELDTRIQTLRELQGHAQADLQVRLQSYADQKLRESTDEQRETVVSLLARVRGEVEEAREKALDPARLDSLLRERVQRASDTLRSDLLLTMERKMGEAEDRLLHAGGQRVERFESLERNLQEHAKELLRTEEALHTELGDLERRLAVLSDRLVPVVRKSWLRIAELEKAGGSPVDVDLRLTQIRRELKEELRRHDAEVGDRVREIRDRMETTISHQGKVWLTLIHQLSQLTEDRRNAAPGVPLAGAALAPEESALDDAASDDEEEPERPYRRRTRRPSRSL
ncbi:MAG TPA: hypothetical protein VGU43_03175 [Thermoplasmata archaeon]|nr:hypothetical protein [Thermoplasmata archaeon]